MSYHPLGSISRIMAIPLLTKTMKYMSSILMMTCSTLKAAIHSLPMQPDDGTTLYTLRAITTIANLT